jgi:hypothetical protein
MKPLQLARADPMRDRNRVFGKAQIFTGTRGFDFSAPKFERNYGYIVAAIAQHFGMNFDDVAAEGA